MTEEVLATIQGAREAGATEFVVSDSHGNGESAPRRSSQLATVGPTVYSRPMPSQQGRVPTARGVAFRVVLGLVATGAALTAASLLMPRSTVARAAAPPAPAADPPADLILVGGRIYTLDAQKPWAQALAVRGDRILAVGGDREIRALAGPRTRVLDLRGKFALPGFNDAHVHIESTGALL